LLRVGDEEVLLRVHEETMEVLQVSETVNYNMAYKITDAEWLTLILNGFEALENQELKGSKYLRALFPYRPYIFWNADFF
jgi:hypothetical protein